jgi:hypothetical protein
MAVLPVSQYPLKWLNGDTDRVAAYAFLNVNGGDTADLSNEFSSVRRASILGVTVVFTGSAAVSGTVVTIPTGASGDSVILCAYGCSR